MDQTEMPLVKALLDHFNRGARSYHVPGHKSGAISDEAWVWNNKVPDVMNRLKETLAIDVTEISGLDDLHQPSGPIAEAQRLAADCFGSEHTFFLVNGSTTGNMALILAVCEPGDLVILPRNVHKSIIHGLVLAGAQAVFLPVSVEASTGLHHHINLEQLQEVLEQYPQAKAVFLTNPNYYGASIDLEPIVKLVHAYHKPIFIDEAHGAHFGLHPKLPQSALACGADAVVQSTHKMLTAMTMGSMLHIQGHRIDRARIQQRLSMLQSSSPSYPIMASLDAARYIAANEAHQWIERLLKPIEEFKQWIKEHTVYGIFELASEAYQDPFKITLFDQTGMLNGYTLQRELEARGCFIELADPLNVLIVLSLGSTREDLTVLRRVLEEIECVFALKEKELEAHFTNTFSTLEHIKQVAASRPIHFQLSEWNKYNDQQHAALMEIEAAVGKQSAEMVIPYPPGIPVLFPGEWITEDIASYLQQCAALGARFQGASDPNMRKLLIYKS